jgi:teichuronic acid biosynthesis glycosyltransferase TuaG
MVAQVEREYTHNGKNSKGIESVSTYTPWADVSVVMPMYNSSTTILRALLSVASQTCKPIEVILVDDASTDNTLDLIEQFSESEPDCGIRIIRQPFNQGPSAARNAGWKSARGQYVAFLDADDAWHPRKIEIQYAWMLSNPLAAISAHGCPLATGAEWPGKLKETVSVAAIHKWMLLLSNRFSTPTVMLKSTLPYQFVEQRRYSEDYLLWLQITADGIPIYYIDLPLAAIYKAPYGAGGLSANLWQMECGELNTYIDLLKSKRLGAFPAALLCAWSLIKYVRRLVLVCIR